MTSTLFLEEVVQKWSVEKPGKEIKLKTWKDSLKINRGAEEGVSRGCIKTVITELRESQEDKEKTRDKRTGLQQDVLIAEKRESMKLVRAVQKE